MVKSKKKKIPIEKLKKKKKKYAHRIRIRRSVRVTEVDNGIQKKRMPIPSAKTPIVIEKPVPVTNLKNPIVVVTDCSGMECPIVALENLGVRIVHIASCDVDKSAKKFIIHNFKPYRYFDDITIRDHKKEFAALRKLGWLYVVAQCSKRARWETY
jgi:hypothetical protein